MKMRHSASAAAALALLLMATAASAQPVLEETVIEAAETGWYPRTRTSDRGTVVLHAPQIESWADFETLTAWIAFNATQAASGQSYYGSLHFSAATDTDLAEREVLLHDVAILDLRIDGLDAAAPEYQLTRDAVLARSARVPLDLILEYLTQEIPLPSASGLATEPPEIFVAMAPAILLAVDGAPAFIPVGDTQLQFVLNTNWDVLREGNAAPLYLCYQDRWLSAPAIEGPWSRAETLPAALEALPADANWESARRCNEPAKGDEDSPLVFYATGPAELLALDGQPQWQNIAGTNLRYAENTRQELFEVDDRLYVLLSGRWFSAADFGGEWQYAAALPDAFQHIPADGHPKSYVRKSVPGTPEAWEAALVASIPRTARIERGSEAELGLEVGYGGKPVFQPIEGTSIAMGMNTSYQVFEHEGSYYVCHNAVWMKGDTPEGPWSYADSVPAEFKKIPPSSPAYNTTYVDIGEADDESIEYAYTAGYENAYVSNDTVVQGTGFLMTAATVWLMYEAFEDDYWHGSPYYPYYPWPPTYGYGSWYDPDTGRYGETVVGYGPYGAARGTAVFNPETGVYARGQAMWDSDEYAGRGYAYNPNTQTSIAGNRYFDFDDDEGWSNRVARRGDEWRYAESEWEDGEMRTEFESSFGTQGEVTREREGDSIVSSGTVSGDDRSIDFEGEFEDGKGTLSLSGSEGGSGEINRELEDGELSGSGSFSRDGKSLETDTTRTAEGVKREFETGDGGQGTALRRGDENAFAFESGSGDVYAGRDGNVYQKTDDGWNRMENPRANSESTSALPNRESAGRLESTTIDASSRRANYNTLDRDFQSRQRGYDRYANHRAARGRTGGMRGRRR